MYLRADRTKLHWWLFMLLWILQYFTVEQGFLMGEFSYSNEHVPFMSSHVISVFF